MSGDRSTDNALAPASCCRESVPDMAGTTVWPASSRGDRLVGLAEPNSDIGHHGGATRVGTVTAQFVTGRTMPRMAVAGSMV